MQKPRTPLVKACVRGFLKIGKRFLPEETRRPLSSEESSNQPSGRSPGLLASRLQSQISNLKSQIRDGRFPRMNRAFSRLKAQWRVVRFIPKRKLTVAVTARGSHPLPYSLAVLCEHLKELAKSLSKTKAHPTTPPLQASN
jgi:hypothetical protein